MEENGKLAQYLNGEMSPEERIAFEQEIENNSELQEEVNLHRRLEMALGGKEEKELGVAFRGIMDRIGDVGEESMEEDVGKDEGMESQGPVGDQGQESDDQTGRRRGSNRNRYRVYFAIAASIILLAVVAYGLLVRPDPQTSKELFAENYEAYDASRESRNNKKVPRNMLDDAFDPYEAGDYKTALPAFQKILELDSNNGRPRFYIGMCQLELKAFDEAKGAFRWLVEDGKNLYLDQATWYWGMICLQEEDTTCVKEKLGVLAAKSAGFYRTKAGEILEELGGL